MGMRLILVYHETCLLMPTAMTTLIILGLSTLLVLVATGWVLKA